MNTSNAPLSLVARGLHKSYRGKTALAGVDFSIPSGRIVGLIGPNGAGKTTALKAILGLTDFDGHLEVLGRNPRKERDALMEEVCFIADVAVLPRWMKVKDAVDFVAGVHPRFNRERCRQLLEATKLTPSMRVKQMSKGMIVQLHLALVMSIDARLLVLDEPTLGLDILYRKQFYQQLLEDYFDQDKTILVTTHQIEEIEHILTDVLFIRDGRITLDASMETLAERFTEVLVGPEQLDAARALSPIGERAFPFGKTVLLYDGQPRHTLAALGEVRNPGLADLFVASMKGTYA